VLIAIKDNGVGMTAEHIGQIFREGVQINANEMQNGGGSGFGLYISQAIVNLHQGGRIWVDSNGEGTGSVFFIELTMSRSQPSFSTACSIDMLNLPVNHLGSPGKFVFLEDSGSTPLPPLRILVVDDSLTNRKMLMKMLKIHACVQCDDGLSAVSEISRSIRNGYQNSYNSTRKYVNSSNGRSRSFSVTFRSECTVNTASSSLPSYDSMMDMNTDEKSDTDDYVVLPFDMVLMVRTCY
jgi:CheY-like chemotaxis protein